MKKIFFMDIDGVLVNGWSMQQKVILIDEMTDYEPYGKECVVALNLMLEAFSPHIVLHSSRRYQYSEKNFIKIWADSGIKFDTLEVLERYGDQDNQWFNSPNEEKEYDIKKYIAINTIKVEDYIILEDEKLSLDNLFLLNGNIGLQIKDAEKMIRCI